MSRTARVRASWRGARVSGGTRDTGAGRSAALLAVLSQSVKQYTSHFIHIISIYPTHRTPTHDSEPPALSALTNNTASHTYCAHRTVSRARLNITVRSTVVGFVVSLESGHLLLSNRRAEPDHQPGLYGGRPSRGSGRRCGRPDRCLRLICPLRPPPPLPAPIARLSADSACATHVRCLLLRAHMEMPYAAWLLLSSTDRRQPPAARACRSVPSPLLLLNQTLKLQSAPVRGSWLLPSWARTFLPLVVLRIAFSFRPTTDLRRVVPAPRYTSSKLVPLPASAGPGRSAEAADSPRPCPLERQSRKESYGIIVRGRCVVLARFPGQGAQCMARTETRKSRKPNRCSLGKRNLWATPTFATGIVMWLMGSAPTERGPWHGDGARARCGPRSKAAQGASCPSQRPGHSHTCRTLRQRVGCLGW